jgi:hypothetical protein
MKRNLLVILLDGDHLHLELGLGSLQHLNLIGQNKSLTIRTGYCLEAHREASKYF